ncbi:phosphatidylserine decarboxylase-domain-containing protein [Zopfochytrium polystomum]|nr:phosphatidylserine decarboxylase-domain-containing protein [Zopfochytrium polystomum]
MPDPRLQKDSTFKRASAAWFDTKVLWRPIPIGLGIAFIAALHLWRVQRRTKDDLAALPGNDDPDLKVEGSLSLRLYAALPLREASRLWGYLNSLTIPTPLRRPLLGLYAWLFGCNLSEMEIDDLAAYPNLGEFFYRRLKEDARAPADPRGGGVLSPADGRVLAFGVVDEHGGIPQVKGATYSLPALLGKYPAPGSPSSSGVLAPTPGKGSRLHFCVIYLAPGDYHRFHSPVDWNVALRRHFAGELLSVSPLIYSKLRNLFILNERVALVGGWAHGFFSMIPVGATNVGGIRIDFDPDLVTNEPGSPTAAHPLGTYVERRYAAGSGAGGVELRRGDEMGGFRLGSTVVLVFEAPAAFGFGVKEGERVRVGQRLGGGGGV